MKMSLEREFVNAGVMIDWYTHQGFIKWCRTYSDEQLKGTIILQFMWYVLCKSIIVMFVLW